MQPLPIYLSLALMLAGKTVSSEENEFCEALVIRECSGHSRGLLKVLESENKHVLDQECDALQATVDCLSVPRCHGNLLTSFRQFVLVTALGLSKESHTCPRLDVETLQRYVTGMSTPCEESKTVLDECHRICHCNNGDLVTGHRVRKQFTAMSLTERRRFIEVLKLAATSPQYRSEYERLTTLHSRVPSKFLHHMPHIFLPWHRWYLLEFENFLRQIDCRVTIPYWDWSRVAEHWVQQSEDSVWSPAPHGLGGNGVFPDRCVVDGPFRESEFHLPWSVGGGCLKRDFNSSCNLPNLEDAVNLILLENFTIFEQTIREQFHTKFHNCVGENMSRHETASFTPEFWLLHGFIDKLWSDWQSKSVANQFQYYTNYIFTMPGSERFPWEYLDLDSLPGGVKVLYEKVPF